MEKHYQKAIKSHFDKDLINFKEQVPIKLKHPETYIGNYLMDFVIADKIILEIKAKPFFSRKDIQQVLAYLRETGLDLGILATFSKYELKYKRILRGF